jgi:hypothetical protein
VRVKPAGLAVLVRHRVGLNDTLPGADRANPAYADPLVTNRVLLDDEPLLAILPLYHLGRTVPELRVDVFVPQIERLEDVAVGIDDIISAAHVDSSFRASRRNWKTKRPFGRPER